MSRIHAEVEEPQDDDAIAKQLLSQFEGPSSHAVFTAGNPGQELRESQRPKASPARDAPPFEIVPPVIPNPNDYEYLPGHFAVRSILELDSTTEKPLYTVRLQSGERQTVRTQLISLAHDILSNLLISLFADDPRPIHGSRQQHPGSRPVQ